MTMILQLLVAAVAVGLSVGTAPPYSEYLLAMEEAGETLQKNVLSMEGNIPLLDDFRRHYAEIVHVVHYIGKRRTGCFLRNYFEEYYPYLNISAPEAISNPELVITEIKDLENKVHNNITELKKLINACVLSREVCDEFIEDIVNKKPDLRPVANVLIATGEAAKDLNKSNEKFEEISKNLKAHQYVSTSPKDLEHIVESVAEIYRNLEPLHPREC